MDGLGIISREQLVATYSDNYTFFENTFSACNRKYSLPSQEYWRLVHYALYFCYRGGTRGRYVKANLKPCWLYNSYCRFCRALSQLHVRLRFFRTEGKVSSVVLRE